MHANHLLELGAGVQKRLFHLSPDGLRGGHTFQCLVPIGFWSFTASDKLLHENADFVMTVHVRARQREKHGMAAVVDIGLDRIEREYFRPREHPQRGSVQRSGSTVYLVGALVAVKQHLPGRQRYLTARTPDLIILGIKAVGPVHILLARIRGEAQCRIERTLRNP